MLMILPPVELTFRDLTERRELVHARIVYKYVLLAERSFRFGEEALDVG